MPQRALHNAGSMSAQGLFATLKAPSARPQAFDWSQPSRPQWHVLVGRFVV